MLLCLDNQGDLPCQRKISEEFLKLQNIHKLVLGQFTPRFFISQAPKKAHGISTLDIMKISLYTEFQTKKFLKNGSTWSQTFSSN